MKICYIADASSIHTVEWIKFFANMKHEVHLISDTKNEIAGVNIHYIGECLFKIHIPIISAIFQIRLKTKKIKKILKNTKPNIIHAHYATNYGYLASLTKYHPLILTCHGSDLLIDPQNSKKEKHFVKSALKAADLITLPSTEMKNQALKIFNESKQIEIIQYGIEIDKFEFEFNNNLPTTFVSTRYLTKKYRVDILISAIKHLKNNSLLFNIIGDGDEKENLINECIDEINNNKINFIGQIENIQINTYLKKSHFYITTSPTDGLSISLLEAFASGCYPILPNNPSNHYVKSLGFELALFEVNNSVSLAEIISSKIHEFQSLEKSVIKNRQLVEQLFSRHKNLKKFEEFYLQYEK